MSQMWEIEFLLDGQKFKEIVTESKKRRLYTLKGIQILSSKRATKDGSPFVVKKH